MVVAFVGWRRNDNQSLTAATYNSVSMTIEQNAPSTVAGEGMGAVWIRPGSTGTFNLVLTWDVAVDSVNIQWMVLSGSATSSTVPSSAVAVNDGGFSTVTCNVTGGSNRLIMGCAFIRGGTGVTSISEGAGQTAINSDFGNEGSDSGIISSKSSYETGTGTVTHSYTYAPTASYDGGVVALAIEGASGGSTTSKTMTDTVTMTDAALDPTYRVRLLSDTSAVTDAAVTWTRRYRVLSDTLDVIDSVVKSLIAGSGVFTKVMTDTLQASDSLVQWLRRVRGPIDTTVLTDGDTYRQSLITATETIDVAEGFVSWRRLRRVMSDNLDLIDGFSKTLAGAGIVYAKVMSDAITLIDDAGRRWNLRASRLSDTIGLSDQVLDYLRLVRALGDDVELSDGTVKIRRTVRSVDESIEVSDSKISTLYLDTLSPVTFKFGASGPPFRFGGT